MQIEFKCPKCPETFDQMESMEAHCLFLHQFLIPRCSTDIAQKQMLFAENLRKTSKLIHKKLMQEKDYILKTFDESQFNKVGRNKRLPLWVNFAMKGQGWYGRLDEYYMDTHKTDYEKLGPHLLKLYKFGKAETKIQEIAKERGIFLE